MRIQITASVANIRNGESLTPDTDVGNLTGGSVLDCLGTQGDYYIVTGLVHKTVAKIYDDVPPPPPPPPVVPEYLVRHDLQKGRIWRTYVPEVFHFDDQYDRVPLTKAWQEFIMAINPGMDGKGFRSLLKWDRAFTNGSGFDNPSGEPRADFINNRDIGAKLPVMDKVRVCGGAILHGIRNGDTLTVETLDGNIDPPSIDYIKDHPWKIFVAYTVLPDGTNNNFPQNGGKPVYFPLVATKKVTVKLNLNIDNKPYPYIMA